MAYKVVDGKVVRTGKPLRHTNKQQLDEIRRRKEYAEEREKWRRENPQPASQSSRRAAAAVATMAGAVMARGSMTATGRSESRPYRDAAFGAHYGASPAALRRIVNEGGAVGASLVEPMTGADAATSLLALEQLIERRMPHLEALDAAHESDDPRAAEQALFCQLRKGQYQGACNRSACLAPGATWYNRGSMKFYCAECAAMLSAANQHDPFCKDAPLCYEVTSAEEAATLHT